MGENSKISWTDATWNPWQGCTKVSPACANCYMFRDMKRYGRDGSFVHKSSDATWGLPIQRWKKGQKAGQYKIPSGSKVFTCSWSDWFHETADPWRGQAWEIIRQRPDLTFQIVTKRTDRILEHLPPDWGDGWPNVWMIATVENQGWADKRIPDLLQVPAIVRGLSIEPLLGPIDLTGWGDHRASSDWQSLPARWEDYVWPDWVPANQREQIKKFWAESYGRNPREWARDNHGQRMPATGSWVQVDMRGGHWGHVDKMRPGDLEGRYLHCWNNIGRVITESGTTIPVSGGIGSGWLSKWQTKIGDYAHKIHWVIDGGESGPKSREYVLEYSLDIQHQCKKAGVAYFRKQLGSFPVATNANLFDFDFEQLEPWGDYAAGVSIKLNDRSGGDLAEWPEEMRVREFPEVEVAA